MFEDFLDHKCDIFHLVDSPTPGGYGIKAAARMVPTGKAAEEDVPCHFHTGGGSLQIVQGEPYSSLEGQVKLSLPIGTGIRKNDIVQSRETGLRYRADVPREIRGHHIIVTLRREGGVKGAI
ncbi:MAG: DUF3599 family protein [Lachnospiraceae bacterium]|nr:DUF3599 family protein [Lachnospiraceae bacterium]